MFLLYMTLGFMLITSIGLLSVPFFKMEKLPRKYFLLAALFIIIFSSSVYVFNNDTPALKQWLTHDENRYQLLQAVNKMGGFNGMLEKIKRKLADNPNDVQGWVILGKLYLGNHDYKNAKDAFAHAVALRPEDTEIKRLYNNANSQ